MRYVAKWVFLFLFTWRFLVAQPKSAIEFYDTTATDATARIGWTGSRSSGRVFVESPIGNEVIALQAGKFTVNGLLTATRFRGDGCELTGITGTAIADGTVGTEDIEDSAVTGAKISRNAISDKNVSPSARISGSKIVPDFGTEDIVTRGKIIARSSSGKSAQLVCWEPPSTSSYRPGSWFAILTKPGDTLLQSVEDMGGGTMQRSTRLYGHIQASFISADTLVATSVTNFPASDSLLKTDVEPIVSCLSKVLLMQGVRFRFRYEDYPELHLPVEPQIGLTAQSVEAVVPEVVRTNPNGYKGIDYAKLVAILINAIKEQQAQIDELREQVLNLTSERQFER